MKGRAEHVASLVKNYFPELHLAERRIRRSQDVTVLRSRFAGGGVVIDVREVWLGGSLASYSYQLITAGQPLLRYDNAPHHPEVETFPHHKHVEGKVKPLHDHSLEAFLKEARQLLEKQSQDNQ